MNERGRRWAVFGPVFVTLALAGVIGVMVVVQNHAQADRVAEADRAAEEFVGQVGALHSEVVEAINDSNADDPGDLVGVVDAAIADPPSLDDAPPDGIERSAAYAEATRLEQSFLTPYRDLRRELRRADVALEFIRACRDALTFQVTDHVGYGVLRDSRPVRERLIPALVRARGDFEDVRVPRGQDQLARDVVAALQHVIDEATRLAGRIDAGRSYFFSYAERFRTVAVAVDDYAIVVKGDVVEAINAVATAR
ncbi:hypothetical protein [Aeromicrobium sp. UC242_57]|uniref:hypothetical protein n=1 Tax=Aeromicrobium sp. UC242_57 TaxID=3374624 RepID=UPI00378BDF62